MNESPMLNMLDVLLLYEQGQDFLKSHLLLDELYVYKPRKLERVETYASFIRASVLPLFPSLIDRILSRISRWMNGWMNGWMKK